MELNELRTEIDKIDDELVRLFGARMNIAAQIADYKKENNLPILMPAREREKLQGVSEQWEIKTVWGVGYKFELQEGAFSGKE